MVEASMTVGTFIVRTCRFVARNSELMVRPFIRLTTCLLCLHKYHLCNFFVKCASAFAITRCLFNSFQGHVIRNISRRNFPIVTSGQVSVVNGKEVILRESGVNIIRVGVRRHYICPRRIFNGKDMGAYQGPALARVGIGFFVQGGFKNHVSRDLSEYDHPFLDITYRINGGNACLLTLLRSVAYGRFTFILPAVHREVMRCLANGNFYRFYFNLSNYLCGVIRVSQAMVIGTTYRYFCQYRLGKDVCFLRHGELIRSINFASVLSRLRFGHRCFRTRAVPERGLLIIIIIRGTPLTRVNVVVFIRLFP